MRGNFGTCWRHCAMRLTVGPAHNCLLGDSNYESKPIFQIFAATHKAKQIEEASGRQRLGRGGAWPCGVDGSIDNFRIPLAGPSVRHPVEVWKNPLFALRSGASCHRGTMAASSPEQYVGKQISSLGSKSHVCVDSECGSATRWSEQRRAFLSRRSCVLGIFQRSDMVAGSQTVCYRTGIGGPAYERDSRVHRVDGRSVIPDEHWPLHGDSDASHLSSSARLCARGQGRAPRTGGESVWYTCGELLRDEESVAVLCIANPQRCSYAARPGLAGLWVLVLCLDGARRLLGCPRRALATINLVLGDAILSDQLADLCDDSLEFGNACGFSTLLERVELRFQCFLVFRHFFLPFLDSRRADASLITTV